MKLSPKLIGAFHAFLATKMDFSQEGLFRLEGSIPYKLIMLSILDNYCSDGASDYSDEFDFIFNKCDESIISEITPSERQKALANVIFVSFSKKLDLNPRRSEKIKRWEDAIRVIVEKIVVDQIKRESKEKPEEENKKTKEMKNRLVTLLMSSPDKEINNCFEQMFRIVSRVIEFENQEEKFSRLLAPCFVSIFFSPDFQEKRGDDYKYYFRTFSDIIALYYAKDIEEKKYSSSSSSKVEKLASHLASIDLFPAQSDNISPRTRELLFCAKKGNDGESDSCSSSSHKSCPEIKFSGSFKEKEESEKKESREKAEKKKIKKFKKKGTVFDSQE